MEERTTVVCTMFVKTEVLYQCEVCFMVLYIFCLLWLVFLISFPLLNPIDRFLSIGYFEQFLSLYHCRTNTNNYVGVKLTIFSVYKLRIINYDFCCIAATRYCHEYIIITNRFIKFRYQEDTLNTFMATIDVAAPTSSCYCGQKYIVWISLHFTELSLQ